MPCEEKGRLLNLYKAAVTRFSVSVDDLNRTRDKTSKEEYDRLRTISKDAWTSAEDARLDLDGHIKEHEC